MMEDLYLTVKQLNVVTNAEEKPLLKNVGFSIPRGKTVAFVGESGSGKSLTSLALMGLLDTAKLRVIGGEITITPAGLETHATPLNLSDDVAATERRGRDFAMIFQEPMSALNPLMTCGKQVLESALIFSQGNTQQAKRLVLELFQEVQLPNPEMVYEKYPHEISGGQRQRVMIAMAIASSPSLLIADEPTTALDVTVQSEVLKLLKSLQVKRAMSLLFITHDLAVVSEIADEVVVMWRGEMVEAGKVADVLSQPKHPYTQALISCRPAPDSKGKSLITVSDVIESRSTTALDARRVTDNVLLEAASLRKHYRNSSGQSITKALDEISFCINSGETLGLVGESGCGKSTLSRLLMGFIKPDMGTAIYNFSSGGKVILPAESRNDLKMLRSKVQLVFQDPFSSLNPKMLVRDILMEPMMNYASIERAQRDSQIVELLNQVGLAADSANKFPHEFSGGQRQRIVIARALACKPELLICDESVAALDVSVQAQVLNLLNSLKAELGLTLLFISHDLNVVYYMSDRIMVMNKGRIEEMGSADKVFYHPESEYTRRLLSSLPGRKGSIAPEG